jgi:hypothetical protein
MTRENIEKRLNEGIDETNDIVKKEAMNGEFVSKETLLILKNQLTIMAAVQRLMWDNE